MNRKELSPEMIEQIKRSSIRPGSDDNQQGEKKHRYWVSWRSSYHIDDGCSKPPFKVWRSGFSGKARIFSDGEDVAYLTLCAVLEADSEQAIWQGIAKYYPDYVERFINPVDGEWQPNDRFPGFDETRVAAE